MHYGMSIQPAVCTAPKGLFGFLSGQFVTIALGAENGIVEGFSESLRGKHPKWFSWLVRLVLYRHVGKW